MKTVKYTKEEDFQCLEDLKETSAELTLIHMGRENCQPYHVFSGTRDEYILHFVTAGHGLYTADGNTISVGPGQVFLIRPNQPVVYVADSRDPWSYSWVGFKGSRTESVLRQCGFTRTKLCRSMGEIDDYVACFDELLTHVSLRYSDSLYREALLMKLIALLCSTHEQLSEAEEENDTAEKGSPYAAQAMEYIAMNYMREISISDIASRIGISRTHLNRVFRAEYNLPVQDFLIEYRMQKAAGLLSSTDLSVKEIAIRTGYIDPLVFSKAFKKRYGESPKNYRFQKAEMELRQERPGQT